MKELLNLIKSEWRSLNLMEKITGAIIITVMFVLFTGQALYSAAISGTNIAAPIVPFDTSDTYPTHDAQYGKGGMMQFQLSTSRNAIPAARRTEGMIVYVVEKGKAYQLKGGILNSNWTDATFIPQLGVNYFDGRPGTPYLFVNISGGCRTHTYSAAGDSPLPAPWAFNADVYSGGAKVTPLRVRWWTGPGGLVSGSSTGSTFTPTLASTFTASHNSYIVVMATYSTTAATGGKRSSINSISIPATKIGPQGIPGQDANVSEPNIRTAMSTTASNSPLVVRASSGAPSKFEVWDPSNNTRNYIDGNGYQYFLASNGAVLTKITSGGDVYLYTGSAFGNEKLAVKISALDRSWEIYRGDGVTVAFKGYSNGKWKGQEGWPSTTGLALTKTPDGSGSWVAGAGGSPGGATTQVQYNNAGVFAGSTKMAFDAATGTLTITGAMVIK